MCAYNIITSQTSPPTPQGRDHKLENNILQKFSYRSQNSEPQVRLHSLWGLAPEERAPRAFAFEDQQGLIASTPQNWENRDSVLRGHTQVMCIRIQEKSSDFMGAWARHTCWSWRASRGKHKRWLTVWGQGPEGGDIREYSLGWALLEATFWQQDLAPLNSLRLQCWDASGREHSPTHPQTGCLKTSWACSRL